MQRPWDGRNCKICWRSRKEATCEESAKTLLRMVEDQIRPFLLGPSVES